jgi:hypothetical protein
VAAIEHAAKSSLKLVLQSFLQHIPMLHSRVPPHAVSVDDVVIWTGLMWTGKLAVENSLLEVSPEPSEQWPEAVGSRHTVLQHQGSILWCKRKDIEIKKPNFEEEEEGHPTINTSSMASASTSSRMQQANGRGWSPRIF